MTTPDPGATPRLATVADAEAMSALHASCIGEGFLVTLGPSFLGRLYRRIVLSARAFAFVVDTDGGVAGYVACAIDTGAFYREFAQRDGVVAGAVALPRIVRKPRHVWETWRHGTRADANDAAASEILALAVAPAARGRHVGSALVSAAVGELRTRGVESARVVTATGNISAVRAYERAGFRRSGSDEVHRGVSQEVLRWP
jgi:ribosomal protein S18 acetylase RimI-like enzyme